MEAGLSLPRGARLTHTLQSPWEIASQWVGPREVYPEETPELAAVLTALSTARIERADVGYKGTQLKALLVLDGGQKVVFKPKRWVSAFKKRTLTSPTLGISVYHFCLPPRPSSGTDETTWWRASPTQATTDTMPKWRPFTLTGV